MSYCAPNVDQEDHYTCFTYNELKEIAKTFNDYIKINKICKNECEQNEPINLKLDKKDLWYEIYTRLNELCPYEYCWISLNFIDYIKSDELKQKIKFFTFRPKVTLERYGWLTTQHIDEVLFQYEEKYNKECEREFGKCKYFKFVGTKPSDFYDYEKLDLDELREYKKWALVLNLDSAEDDGSHWVTLFVDNVNKTIEYFDSVGRKPNKNIDKFISIVKRHFKNYKYLFNDIKHQNENSECGTYSIYYIIKRLKGDNFESINKTDLSDKKMNKLRDIFFRPYY